MLKYPLKYIYQLGGRKIAHTQMLLLKKRYHATYYGNMDTSIRGDKNK